MRVTVLQPNLQKGLNIVSRAIPSRPTMPILNNVFIETDEQRLKLAATNLEMSITCWIGCSIEEEGATTIPGKTFSDLVSNLSEDKVFLEYESRSQNLHIQCGGNTGKLRCMDVGGYPVLPQSATRTGAIIAASKFKEMVSHVDFATAKDDNRPVLTGILTQFEGDTLTMAAADGYRLAVRNAPLEHPVDEDYSIIIPAKAMTEVAKIIGDQDETVAITILEGRNQVMFHLKHVDVACNLIEGSFPDYHAIIPKSHKTTTRVFKDDLLKACKRAEVFAKDSANAANVVVEPSGNSSHGNMQIASQSQEKGSNQGVLDASVDGDPLEISFNIRYLIEVLNVISENEVILETSGAGAPGLLRPIDRDDFIHVIMPMSVGR